ncbi:MAG: 50S ribosomal protein L3 [Phycisphaerales bacterium]|nr:50S ribosomal protein L3 [Phycisphaerales bacterium]
MGVTLLGKKIGMTRVFSEDGKQSVPVTVLQMSPCVVTQIRTPETDGYSAVQVGWGEIKPRNASIPMIGHDAKAGSAPRRVHVEFRCDDGVASGYELGQEVGLAALEGVQFVDAIGTSKGKGFQGTMKRHGFKGQQATHGVERKHRSPGSIGAHATNRGHCGKLKKGKRMAGQMGAERVTVRSLPIVKIDTENNLLLVKGPVPGANGGTIEIRPAIRLNRSKGKAKSA